MADAIHGGLTILPAGVSFESHLKAVEQGLWPEKRTKPRSSSLRTHQCLQDLEKSAGLALQK